MRIVTVLFFVCLAAGCANYTYRKNFEVEDQDFHSIAVATFKLIDPQGTITTVVMPPDIDPRARAALKKMKALISAAEIPQSRNYVLPEGYFVLQTFEIADGEAMIAGQLGPVTRSLTAANIPDCGKIYTVAFYVQGADWVSHSYKIETCTESRHWVPIDAAQPQP